MLAICFRDGQALDALDIERILSFDMEWISPDEAEKAVQALIGKGWLSGEENALRPTVSLEGVQSPLGWFPRPSRLLMPVSPSQEEPASEKNAPEPVEPDTPGSPRPTVQPTADASNDLWVSVIRGYRAPPDPQFNQLLMHRMILVLNS